VPEPVVQAPVVGTIDAPKRAKRPSVDPDEQNVSQVWYDEGEDGASRSRAPSMADSLYDDDAPPQGRRWGLIIGVLSLLLVGGTVAFALSRGGTKPTPADGSGSDVAMGAPADAAPSMIVEDPPAIPANNKVMVASKPTTGRPTTNGGSRTPSVPRETGGPRRPAGPDFGFAPPGTPDNGGFLPPGTTGPTNPITAAPPPVTNVNITPVTPPPVKTPGITDTPEDPYGTPIPTPPPTTVTDTTPPPDTGEGKAGFFAQLGSSQLANGDTTGAASNFKKALELDPKNASAMIGMGDIALRQGLFGDAIAHLRRAAKFAPRNAKVFVLLGEAYLNSGNNNEAANQFKKALQLDPDNSRARDGYNEASSRVPPPSD
jgi:Tetratricopeptide repeat